MKKLIIPAVCLLTMLLACQGLFYDDIKSININTVTEASSLPYEFVKRDCPGSQVFPISLSKQNRTAAYFIENNWHPPDTISSVLFKWLDSNHERTIRQFNIDALEIQGHYPADLDNDGIQELAITYIIRDTLRLEILDATDGSLQHMVLASGGDRNQSGFWDGWSNIFNRYDIDEDGVDELFITCCSGYDLYPRKIICADWREGTIAWEYDMPGFVSCNHAYIVYDTLNDSHSLIFGASSPCNGAQSNGMDDCHSYLIRMSPQGELIWRYLTGPHFTHTEPLIINYNNDQRPDILTGVHTADSIGENSGHIIISNLDGKTLDSIALPGSILSTQLLDINMDGNDEVCVGFSDNSVGIYSQNMHLIQRLNYASHLEFECMHDFLERGEKQILASIPGNGIVLFDKNFKALAFLPSGKATSTFMFDSLQSHIFIGDNNGGCFYALAEAPWYAIFSRHPFIAFLAGFIPLAAVAAIAWIILFKFRQKNILISNQRDSLNLALEELRTAQQKLIAAEKFEQAKHMAGAFAHEIRNALFPAKASIKRINEESLKQQAKTESVNKFARIANDAVSKAIELTTQISEYTKLDSFCQPENVNIESVVEEVLEANQLRLEEHSAILDISGGDQICIESNRRQFFAVINNLLLNSMDACRDKDECKINIRWFKNGSDVILEFSDNGPGIPPELREKVFNAFCSYKERKGIGLGLAIVRRVVEIYGGSILLESETGVGTKFTLNLKESAG